MSQVLFIVCNQDCIICISNVIDASSPNVESLHIFYISENIFLYREKQTGIMKANSLQWLGHIERMEDNRETKLAYTQEINDRRPRGRPRRRWRDNTCTDLQALGINDWQEKVHQRDEWRWIVSAAKNLNGSERWRRRSLPLLSKLLVHIPSKLPS